MLVTSARTENLVFSTPLPEVSLIPWIESAPEVYSATIMDVIIITVMLYDILITLDDEKEYIWNSQWSNVKVIFLIVRYLPLSYYLFGIISFSFPSDYTCLVFKWCGCIVGLIVGAATNMFLAYRVYAFCAAKQNKCLLVFLISTFFGWETTVVLLTAVLLQQDITAPNPVFRPNFFIISVCTPVTYPPKMAVVWVGTLCYQSVLFLCFILVPVYKRVICYGILFRGSRQAPLYAVFLRDGLWAYFFIVVASALNLVSVFRAKAMAIPFLLLLTMVSSICTCRLVLNIRSAAYKPVSDISIYV